MTDKLRLLLLQARNPGDPVRRDERECFAEQSGLNLEQIATHDLLKSPPTARELATCDAVFIGGSGDYYVSKGNLPNQDRFYDSLRELVSVGKPTFASCYGYQSLVVALGGDVLHDPPATEVGTYTVTLTEAGQRDELFGQFPASFAAQMGHKDRATRHPEGLCNLASSELSPNQAFRIPGKPIWATQFHPELTRERNYGRFLRYLEGYASHLSEAERQAMTEKFQASPHTVELLRRFISLVF